MAQYNVTYKCGHVGTEALFGPTAERERKLRWMEQNKVCRDCYIASKTANPDPVRIFARFIPAFLPSVAAELAAKQRDGIAKKQAELERLQRLADLNIKQQDSGIYWGHPDYKSVPSLMEIQPQIATLKKEIVQDNARLAGYEREAKQEPREARIELVVVGGFAIKDALKARGYRYSDSTGLSTQGGQHVLNLMSKTPGWVISVDKDGLAAEISALATIAPGSKIEPLDIGHNLLIALYSGRTDLLPQV